MHPEYGTSGERSNGSFQSNCGDSLVETKGSVNPRQIEGSSFSGAVFNFTKSIVGAGITGLGGAFAISGGLVSIAGIVLCAILAKLSFDLLIFLSLTIRESPTSSSVASSYEDVGAAAFGGFGLAVVIFSKAIYTLGTMVVYVIIVKDNFASAISHLTFGGHNGNDAGDYAEIQSSLLIHCISNSDIMTIFLSTIVILPLCLLRDLKPFATISLFGNISIVSLVVIVITLFFTKRSEIHEYEPHSFYIQWLQVRGGIVQSLGTFIFTFVAHATVHLTYDSLRPDLRSFETWTRVSSISLSLCTLFALLAGLFVYMTFWLDATSSMFALYPSLSSIYVAKLLLTITIAVTYPFLMMSCREMIIISLIGATEQTEASLSIEEASELIDNHSYFSLPTSIRQGTPRSWLQTGGDRQLTRGYHILLTSSLWSVTVGLGLVAPSLGDVLNFVGCATGTVFSFRILGYNHTGAFIFLVGCPLGIIGTYYSFIQLLSDLYQ